MTKCYFWWALIAKPKDPMNRLEHTFHLSTKDVYNAQHQKNFASVIVIIFILLSDIFHSSFTEVNRKVTEFKGS